MFKDQELFPLFPTFVWAHQIAPETFGGINRGIRDRLDELMAATPDKDPDRLWQTAHDLDTLPEMAALNGYFDEAIRGVLNFLEVEKQAYRITGCWANVGRPGIAHRGHMHANNFLSGVYYVSVPDGGDAITFYDPRAQVHIIAPKVRRVNNHNSDNVEIRVKEGMLVIFPAWLVHSVPSHSGQGLRISIAFNMNFTSFTEEISPPKWTPNLPTHP